MRAICFLVLLLSFAAATVLASPFLVDTNLQLRLVLNTPSDATSIRIVKDPRNNQLYYLKDNGDIYSVDLIHSTSAKMYSAADHGLSGTVDGFAIGPDGTMYVLANFNTSDNHYGYVYIMKGVLDGFGNRAWSLLAQTDIWPRGGRGYDHNCSALLVSQDGQYLYVNAGSRTDHGEVEDNGGLFPDTRDVPLTAKIFRLPANGSNLFLTNDLTALMNAGYVFAQGTRNAFDFAFAPNGDLFATENGPDRDMADSLYWLRQGLHYGFPWRMGGMDNPQQFADYNPATDLLLNSNFSAVANGFYHNDPTFPPPPTNFTDPVISLGPDANEYRDPADGSIKNASQNGQTLSTFTAHRSPLGLVFDTAGSMAAPYQYHGFLLSWTAGDPNGDSIAGPFDDASQDMVDLDLTKLGNTNYQTRVTRIAGGFANPIDAEIISNKVYIIELGGSQGLWEITFPSSSPAAPSITVSDGTPTVTFFGIPNRAYGIQRSTNLNSGAGWGTVANINTTNTGQVQFTDFFGDLTAPPPAAYYRLAPQ